MKHFQQDKRRNKKRDNENVTGATAAGCPHICCPYETEEKLLQIKLRL